MADTIEFTEEAVKEYLDGCIVHWRQIRDQGTVAGQAGTVPSFQAERSDLEARWMARHYIDAYQSVRSSLFGELLP